MPLNSPDRRVHFVEFSQMAARRANVGELVTTEWDSMFSQPANDNRALNVVLSFHCDAVTQTLQNAGILQLIQRIQQIYQQLGLPIPTIPLPNACSPLPLTIP